MTNEPPSQMVSSMGKWGKRLKNSIGARAFVARVLTFAFVLHAFVPQGFVPDLASLRDGRFEIVICTGNGLQTLQVDADGQPIKSIPSDPSPDSCPFGSLFGKVIQKAFTSEPIKVQFERFRSFSPASTIVQVAHTQGPPSGSRAPPFRLG